MRSFTLLFFALSIALLQSCSSPEDKLIGVWEYDSYEIDRSGIGALSQFLPENIKKEIDNYIDKIGDFTRGNYVFNEDGTFESAFTGIAKDFTSQTGYFTLSPDFKTLTLKTGGTEKQAELLDLNKTHFTTVWKLEEYQIPIKLNLRYRKVVLN